MLGCYRCMKNKRSGIVCHVPYIEQISNCKGFSEYFYRKIISWLISIEILIKANPYYPNQHDRYCWRWVLKVGGSQLFTRQLSSAVKAVGCSWAGHPRPGAKCSCAHEVVARSPSRSGAQHENSGGTGAQRARGGSSTFTPLHLPSWGKATAVAVCKTSTSPCIATRSWFFFFLSFLTLPLFLPFCYLYAQWRERQISPANKLIGMVCLWWMARYVY